MGYTKKSASIEEVMGIDRSKGRKEAMKMKLASSGLSPDEVFKEFSDIRE